MHGSTAGQGSDSQCDIDLGDAFYQASCDSLNFLDEDEVTSSDGVRTCGHNPHGNARGGDQYYRV